jgi:hypothetical protein
LSGIELRFRGRPDRTQSLYCDMYIHTHTQQ